MESLVLKPATQQVYQVQPQRSHPITLRRVLWMKVLRWIDAMSGTQCRKILLRAIMAILIPVFVCVPQFFLGFSYAVLSLHGFAVPKIVALFIAFTYWRLAVRKLGRMRAARGNQNTYRGVPVDELASYLCEQRQFIRDDAMRKFAISQAKHTAIAEELEKHQVLVRGPNNGRVLNEISREQLVRQLLHGFPLAFSNGEWVEKENSYHHFLREQERADRREQEKLERLERKRNKLKREINELQASPFQMREIAA